MGMNATPASERVHIGFFGCRNAGKSSVMNAVTGQNLAVVSEVKGTTTDPVLKSMELLPLGPVEMCIRDRKCTYVTVQPSYPGAFRDGAAV